MNLLAYLDPASGSLIAATVAGGLAGVGVAAKSMWHNRTSRFRKSETGDSEIDLADDQGTEDSADPAEAEHASHNDH